MKKQTPLRLALAAAIVLALLGWSQTPAASHVGTWAHNWKTHLQPLADARYYTKKQSNTRYYTKTQSDTRYYTKPQSNARFRPQTLPLGGTETGTWALSGGSGQYGLADISFVSKLPVAAVAASLLAPGATSEACPGPGQAAPGNLCIYTGFNFSMALTGIFSSDTLSSGQAGRDGAALYMTSSAAQGNAFGTWTVRAPLTATRLAHREAPDRVGQP